MTKYTQLFKPNEKFSSKITVFVCMTTSYSYTYIHAYIHKLHIDIYIHAYIG